MCTDTISWQLSSHSASLPLWRTPVCLLHSEFCSPLTPFMGMGASSSQRMKHICRCYSTSSVTHSNHPPAWDNAHKNACCSVSIAQARRHIHALLKCLFIQVLHKNKTKNKKHSENKPPHFSSFFFFCSNCHSVYAGTWQGKHQMFNAKYICMQMERQAKISFEKLMSVTSTCAIADAVVSPDWVTDTWVVSWNMTTPRDDCIQHIETVCRPRKPNNVKSLQYLRETLIHTRLHAAEKVLDCLRDLCKRCGWVFPRVRGHVSRVQELLKVSFLLLNNIPGPGQQFSSPTEHSPSQDLPCFRFLSRQTLCQNVTEANWQQSATAGTIYSRFCNKGCEHGSRGCKYLI